MTRPDGFQIADVDVGLLADPKFRRLWRDLHDQPQMCEAVVIYLATLLESWSSGQRVAVDEALPMWLDPSDATMAALAKAGLLDKDGMVSETGWASWFNPAAARRETRRASGRAGGLAKGGSSDGKATPEHRQSDAEPYRPSVLPSDSPADRPPVSREGLPNLTPEVATAWESASGRTVLASGAFALDYIDDACRRHPADAVIAAIVEARGSFNGSVPSTQQLTVAVRGILDPLTSTKAAQTDEAEDRANERHARAVQATKRNNHNIGWHTDTPDPMCELCTGAKA